MYNDMHEIKYYFFKGQVF